MFNSSSSYKESPTSYIIYPTASFHYFDHLSLSQKDFSMNVTNCTKPRTYKEACQHGYWFKAMKIELDALAANNTWQLVDKPPHVKPIGSKRVY